MKLESVNGNLRLRWNFQGKRYSLALILKDSTINRIKANQVALTIQSDIETGKFDRSLNKYRIDKESSNFDEDLKCAELFKLWLEWKTQFCDRRTIEWYRSGVSPLEEYFPDRAAISLSQNLVKNFIGWLKPQSGAETQRRKLEAYSACWEWAIEKGYLDSNPWKGASRLIKPPEIELPDPFSKAEVEAIIQGFGEVYPNFVPLVRFLFGTGCRLGEARAVRWVDLSQDCKRLSITGQCNRAGDRKPTKNRKQRQLLLPKSLVQMLLDLKSQGSSGDRNVYIFGEGNIPLNEGKFYKKWKQVLEFSNIKYRYPYSTRHTFVSHALEQGISPPTVAQSTGHSLKVLFQHYAGYLSSTPNLPELF